MGCWCGTKFVHAFPIVYLDRAGLWSEYKSLSRLDNTLIGCTHSTFPVLANLAVTLVVVTELSSHPVSIHLGIRDPRHDHFLSPCLLSPKSSLGPLNVYILTLVLQVERPVPTPPAEGVGLGVSFTAV